MNWLFYFVPALRVVLGLLFIISASLKFQSLKGFATIIASYGILPRRLVKPAAYTQPIVEFLVGWWILSGEFLREAAIVGFVMILVADFFLITAYRKKCKMDNCGCYGVAFKVPLSKKKILENVGWTALFVVLIAATI